MGRQLGFLMRPFALAVLLVLAAPTMEQRVTDLERRTEQLEEYAFGTFFTAQDEQKASGSLQMMVELRKKLRELEARLATLEED